MALDLNYSPAALVDTSTLSNEEWLQWRRKGIGGSDAAAALGLSPYRTARDLFYDKIGAEPSIEEEDKSILFEIGHLLEDVVARIFAKKTGFTVFRDQMMYQHPLYPFMVADVDRFIRLPDGKRGLLECKTAHYDTQFKWVNGAVPRHYEVQVKHYMSVMNIDTAYIACLFSNSENDFVWRKIDRDLEEEENTILQLQNFWQNYVLAGVEPPLTERPDLALEMLSRFYGPADPSEGEVVLDAGFAPQLEQIVALKKEKQAADAEVRRIDSRIKGLYAPIADRLGTACRGICRDGGSTEYTVTYSPTYRTGIPRDGLSRLKAQLPDVYDDYVQTTESRTFRVTRTSAS